MSGCLLSFRTIKAPIREWASFSRARLLVSIVVERSRPAGTARGSKRVEALVG